MSSFKKYFHLRSESLPSASTPQKDDHKAGSLERARSNTSPPSESPPLQAHHNTNIKSYITSFKSKRFLARHLGRAPLPQTNQATGTSARKTANLGTPIASFFTPRPVSATRNGRLESINRPTRRHRQYSIDLIQVPVPQNREKPSDSGAAPDLEIEDETDAFDGDVGSSMESPLINRGLPLDTVRLARRRSKATRYSTGQSPLLVPPRPPFVSPQLKSTKTIYPRSQAGVNGLEPPIRSGVDMSCSSLWTPPAYRSRSGTRTIEDNSFRRPVGSPLRPHDFESDKSALHRATEILQQATTHILADPAFSQSSIFRFFAPFVVFFTLLAAATIIPRYYPFQDRFVLDLPRTLALVVTGVILMLTVLRCCIWLIGILAKSFCETDLAEVFRKRGMVDTNGMRMAEGDMVTALF